MKFVEVKNPKDFFEHEMDNLRFSVALFFTFVKDDGEYLNKQLYKIGRFPIFNKEKNIGILHKVIEEKYPQDIIDMGKEDYKKNGIKHYEWHLIEPDTLVDFNTGKELYVVDNQYFDHLSLFENLIVETCHDHRTKVINFDGTIIWEGNTSYSNIFMTKDYLVIKLDHNYQTNTDDLIMIDKFTGEIKYKF